MMNLFPVAAAALALVFVPFAGSTQTISLGIIGGGTATSGFKNRFYADLPGSPFLGSRYFSESKDYLAGGMLELHLNRQWSVEVNGLFRKLHMTTAAVMPDGSLNSVSPAPVITWQFPVMGKYRFQAWNVNPFVEAGASFRTAGNLNGTNPSHHGATAGVGVEIHWKKWKIAPSARYTRWAADKDQLYRGTTAPNQVEFLVGFSRESESNWRPAGRHMQVGVVVGTNLTADLRKTIQPGGDNVLDPIYQHGTSVQSPGGRSFIPGVMVEFALPRRVSIEVDALYRPISSVSEQIESNGTRYRSTYRFITWEFPILAKYNFEVRGAKPFIGLGPSFRRPQALTHASTYGVVAGAGVEFRLLRNLKVAPTVRYTHWAPDDRFASGGPRRNQTELLVGFSF